MSVFRGRALRATGLFLGLICCAEAKAIAQLAGMFAPVVLETSPVDAQIPLLSLIDTRIDTKAPTTIYAEAELPDDPSAHLSKQQLNVANATVPVDGSVKPTDNDDSETTGRQTKRILYIVPNFRAVSADAALPRQSVNDKLKTATLDSLDYSSFIFYGIQAGIGFMNHSYPEFHTGVAGYGRYYWHTLADSTNENLWVEFLIPAPLHQDTRYYTRGRGGFSRRFVYAFTRTMITRTDEGNQTVNASELIGAGAAAGMANLYYPSPERTFTKTYQRWVTNILIDGGTFVFKEFWPDINNSVFHQQE